MHNGKPDVSFLINRKNPEKYKQIMLNAGVKPGIKILDYGCGIASYSIVASEIAGTKGRIIAADNNPDMIKLAGEEIKKAKVNNVETLLVEKYTDITDSDYGFIFLIDVLHHMDKPREVINYMHSHLKPRGKLLIKFEHFTTQEIKEITTWSDCKSSKNLKEDYWVLE